MPLLATLLEPLISQKGSRTQGLMSLFRSWRNGHSTWKQRWIY